MTGDDEQDDTVLAAVASLRTFDVSQRRTRKLRARCHGQIRMQIRPRRSTWTTMARVAQQLLGPALGAAWSLAYLAEIIRSAATVHRLLP